MNSFASRRILLAVTGLTPQVVTETVYALACKAETPWVPTEIHLITTGTGADHARLNLLGPDGQFHQLRADYGLPAITFPPENIHVLAKIDGTPLDDIRTQADNTHAADFIVDMVRTLTADDSAELHVSITGGRKTMGYYLGYALSLYGRPQDRLSHVLVSEPYETNRNFYYPTPYEKGIRVGRDDNQMTIDARKAEVTLASIPFVRLRQELPPRLLCDEAKLSQVVASANRALQPPLLVLDVDNLKAWADDEPIPLSPPAFMALLWFALRAQRGESRTDYSSQAMRDEFAHLATAISEYRRKYFNSKKEARDLEDFLTRERRGDYFEPLRSNIKKAFEENLGKPATMRYGVSDSVRGKKSLVTLKLNPEQIEIRAARTLPVLLKSTSG